MAKLYIIGDPETGILFVKTDPVMLTHISKETVSAYASSHNMSFSDVFAQIAAGAKKAGNKAATSTNIADLDTSYEAIGKMIGTGAVVSDAQFCFVTDVSNVDWANVRFVIPPIGTALSHLNPPASPEDYVQLRSAPLD